MQLVDTDPDFDPILDPELPIVDPHHHLYPYHHPDLPRGRYMIDDLEADLESGHNIEATIYAECSFLYRKDGPSAFRTVGEAEWAATMARLGETGLYGPTSICQGFIGGADLTLGDAVGDVLDALAAASDNRLCGIRGTANWDSDPSVNSGTRPMAPEGVMGHATWRAGVAQMAARGLVYDAWCYHPQMAELANLVDAFPQLTFVVVHSGGLLGTGRYSAPGVYEHWKAQMQTIAARPNVFMKLGGLAGKRCGLGYDARATKAPAAELAEDWRPYIEPLIEMFGPDRCMFESNFPVDVAAGSYRTVWNAFKHLANGCSESDKAALFSGTARRVYRLD